MQIDTKSAPICTAKQVTVCVYLGSSHGSDPEFTAAARAIGHAIGARGWSLIYGGGQVGLMGELATATMSAGGHVTGVITRHLLDREVADTGIDELVVTDDMPGRKKAMFERADAFVALPGGIGTLEELFEVLCWRYLGLHPKPVGLLNTAGFYDHLLAFLDHATDAGFVRDTSLLVDDDVEVLLDGLGLQAAGQDAADLDGLDRPA